MNLYYLEEIESLSVQLRHVEIIGNILVFDKISFSGAFSQTVWNQLTALPSVLSKEEECPHSFTNLFNKLLDCYNCKRIAIQDEIDCGKWGIAGIHSRTQTSKSFEDYLLFSGWRRWMGDCPTSMVCGSDDQCRMEYCTLGRMSELCLLVEIILKEWEWVKSRQRMNSFVTSMLYDLISNFS